MKKYKPYRLLWIFALLFLAACASGSPSPTATVAIGPTETAPQTPAAAVTALSAASPTAAVASPTGAAQETPAGQPTPAATETMVVPQTGLAPPQDCQPTPPDSLGPFYKSGAPVRDTVGEGYVLEGYVVAAGSCAPLAGAQVEIWMAGPDGEYRDEYRATLFAGEQGDYRFQSHFPPPYSGRPSHIHFQVGAPGYQTLVTQHYPQAGDTGAVFHLVLSPE